MDSQEIYQEMLLAHNEQPHHFCTLPHPSHQAHGYNPLCGDEITVYLQIEDNNIKTVTFIGQSCAICKASASLMTLRLEGQDFNNAEKDAEHILQWLNNTTCNTPLNLGEMEALLGVRRFPMRIKCATLAWHTFLKALKNKVASNQDDSKNCTCNHGTHKYPCCNQHNPSNHCCHFD